MLTRIQIRNFKRLENVDFDLGKSVVLIGPNNSGKTTALQAIALWDIGLRLWNIKRSGKSSPEKRPGVTINRRDIIAIPKLETGRTQFDISSSGRGLQQTLLLLAHLYAHPRTALLLDEPDAHLEILRQRQIYQLLTEVSEKMGSQIIAASHSEVVLNEAADRDVVIAFVGKPHRIDDRSKGSHVLKSLRKIGCHCSNSKKNKNKEGGIEYERKIRYFHYSRHG